MGPRAACRAWQIYGNPLQCMWVVDHRGWSLESCLYMGAQEPPPLLATTFWG
ncbi:uncharacterized protein EI90DRAFT_3073361 [Cantharellus anzutake]|uniref:uncharacterized protein n=1 Tax=Cantharellus anzutake TaxID=1750568 RepID=UPI00190803E1|nr:uncharacterized protein EI90DRAFT_3073361 [Cantharellus anzutake]KAF8325206.1 hypothetical protein EI90DRAFT_3073361 [Cantharellus anzutake]